MKKLSIAFSCCLVSFLSFGQATKTTLAIIPEPVSITTKPGQFVLPKNITIQAGTSAEMVNVTSYLKTKLATATGALITVRSKFAVPATIKLLLSTQNRYRFR